MKSRSTLGDSFRFGRLSRTESAAVWPILLVATIGFLTLGSLLILVARDTIERQTDLWIESSLRASATTGRLAIEARFREAHALVRLIASRVLIQSYLSRIERGLPPPADYTPAQDLGMAMHGMDTILGLSLLDNHGVVVQTVGALPPHARDAFEGEVTDTAPILVKQDLAIKVMAEVRAADGSVLGATILYYRLDPSSLPNQSDLGVGSELSYRVAGLIDGQPRWLLPVQGEMGPDDAATLTPLLAPGPHHEQFLRDEHREITGIRLPFPNSAMLMAIDLEPGLLQRVRIHETNLLTLILVALTTIGALGLTLLIRPFAHRLVRQRQQLDQTIDELQRSEEFNRRITANIPDRIEILDREGRVRSMSEGGTMGQEVSEIAVRSGARWLSFWSGEDQERAAAALAEARAKNLGRFQGLCDRGSGTLKWWDVAVAPILDASGAVDEILAVSRDITEEKLAEQRLRDSELRYQVVASATNDVIWDWTIASDQVWWNEAITSRFGYQAESVGTSADWWAERIHPDDAQRVTAALHGLIISQSTAWRAEYRFRRADGAYLPVLDRGHILRDGDGRAVRMIGALFDLSDRRRAIELETRRTRHAQLRADVSAALVAFDAERAMLQSCVEVLAEDLDLALARIWLLEPDEARLRLQASAGSAAAAETSAARTIALGSDAIGVIGAERRPHISHALGDDARVPDRDVAAREGLISYVGLPLIAGETLVGVLDLFARSRIESDTVDALDTVADLVAQGVRRKALETRLAAQAAVMQRTNSELEQFTYVASHDLQEPLRTIANYLTLLERRYQETFDDKAKRYMTHSIEAAKRLQALIKDLLAFSRAGHRESMPLVEIDSQEVFNEVVASLAGALGEAKAVVVGEGLPVVRYNRVQLGQLLQNLIGNAIKYRGEEDPQVVLRARDTGAEWEFCVRDNGIGIDPAYFARIFEVFQRLHGRDQYQGTGIGLALCRKIVVSHGGRIWVESALGSGSAFFFTIPK